MLQFFHTRLAFFHAVDPLMSTQDAQIGSDGNVAKNANGNDDHSNSHKQSTLAPSPLIHAVATNAVRGYPSMMRSQCFIPTTREEPSGAERISHKLMIRSGMVSQTAAGIYAWLPLGLRVLQKISDIIRDEQVKAGACEMLMPTIQRAQLWQTSGRYDSYGKELLRIKDRWNREMLYGPTNEEQITDIFAQAISSYRDLPLNVFQIQWKFRDEIRPRFGVMRGREFLMKDGYSFDLDAQGAAFTYRQMVISYLVTLARMGLKAIPLVADTGPIGGAASHEFVVITPNGETDVLCTKDILNLPTPQVPDYNDKDHIDALFTQWTTHPACADQTDTKVMEGIEPERIVSTRGIEVGHVFSFATKYSETLDALVENQHGKRSAVHMGSYGIGVSRLVAAFIENQHDDHGIIWPSSVAPFDLTILSLQPDDITIANTARDLFVRLDSMGCSVLLDDRMERPGVKFSDADLIGIPWQVVISKRGLAQGTVEVKSRHDHRKTDISIDSLVQFLQKNVTTG